MIKIVAWNIRGLNNPLKQKEVRKYARTQHPSIFCLSETKVKACNLDATFKKCFRDWNVIHNCPPQGVCRIGVGWDPKVIKLDLLASTDQVLTCHISLLNTYSFFGSFVYASNEHDQRTQLWNHLRMYARIIAEKPWIIMGDFNIVRGPHERQGGCGIDVNAVSDFNNCLYDIGCTDLTAKGCWMTWDNHREGTANIKSKLDIILINDGWLKNFPFSEGLFESPGLSDHCPGLAHINTHQRFKKCPFRFYTLWMKHKDFSSLLKDSWAAPIIGNPMLRVNLKLKRLKIVLKLNGNCYSHISQRVAEAWTNLKEIQELHLNSQVSYLDQEVREARINYAHLREAEEAYYHKKNPGSDGYILGIKIPLFFTRESMAIDPGIGFCLL
uniref:Putative AP endonuclease/reverse transcriptase n=1 Tax=Davidia involucrata TaxID=16924 RepID=A0A5B7AM54_DAVIN